jgi:hypothetical protein
MKPTGLLCFKSGSTVFSTVAQWCHHISISAEFNFSLGANYYHLGANIIAWVQTIPPGRTNYCLGAKITTWA